MVKSGTVSAPGPFPSPPAGSPSAGALAKRPGRAPSGSDPFNSPAACKPAIARSVLELPALAAVPSGAFGGGATPADRDGDPMPSGNPDLAPLDPPAASASIGASVMEAGPGSRAPCDGGGGGTNVLRTFRAASGSAALDLAVLTLQGSGAGASNIEA